MKKYLDEIILQLIEERERQEEKWGVQRHPDGTGSLGDSLEAWRWKKINGNRASSWKAILAEEFYEALAEEPGSKELEEELVQVAAVAMAWLEDLKRRRG